VKDVLSAITGGGWSFLVGWVFPCAIFVALAAFFLFPPLDHLAVAKDIMELGTTQRTLLLAFISVALGVLLSAIQTPLYRLLEGYYWPTRIRRPRTEKYLSQKRDLKSKVEQAAGLEQALLYEQYFRFPDDDQQVAPTRFANGLRTLETYGSSRFRLDSQIFWSELSALAPEPLQTDHERARATVDFFVAMIYLSATFGLLALMTAWWGDENRIGLTTIGLIALLLLPAWYRLAVNSIDYWRATVKAFVNLGRKELASALNLQLPSTFEEEREMWKLASQLAYYGYSTDLAKQLDRFRALPSSDDEADPGPSKGADQRGSRRERPK
jgi:hypothetical protein